MAIVRSGFKAITANVNVCASAVIELQNFQNRNIDEKRTEFR